MPRNIDYKCTSCGEPCEREKLIVRKSVFMTMGVKGKTIRSRVIDWLCPTCLAVHPEFNAVATYAAPGNADSAVAIGSDAQAS